jgi:glucans biosynthesis protein C
MITNEKTQMVVSTTNGSIFITQIVRASHLDWLRVLVVFILIPYHTAWIFSNTPWWINNSLSNPAAVAFYQIFDQFQMPLLFTIAGTAAWFSLGIRTWKQYFVERLWRLFVPIISGMLILNAPIFYFSALYHNQGGLYDNSFFIWYQTYLKTMLFPWQTNWTPGTFWFIWYLFIYSIGLLPLLIFLRKHVRMVEWVKIGGFFEKLGIFVFLFLLAILPVLVQLYPPPNVCSGFQIFYFVFFFIYGFFLYSSQQMQHCIDKFGPLALIIGTISITLVIILIFPNSTTAFGSIYWRVFGSSPGSTGQNLYLILRGVSCWFSIIGLIFLARRWGDFNNRFLQYSNEAVLPFYLMHATFIISIGYYVIPLNINLLVKFIIIALSSLGATLSTFEILKRFKLTRILIGMRKRTKYLSQI